MKNQNNNKYLGLYLPEEAKKKLEEIARVQQRSVSGLVRIIVEQYLKTPKL